MEICRAVLLVGEVDGTVSLINLRISVALKMATLKYEKWYQHAFGVTLIITTFNRPDALDWVLGSVSLQDSLPDEVIADDGSTENTCCVIEKWRGKLNILHCWQADDPFRQHEFELQFKRHVTIF